MHDELWDPVYYKHAGDPSHIREGGLGDPQGRVSTELELHSWYVRRSSLLLHTLAQHTFSSPT